MALDQSALLELLDVLKAADAGDVVRRAVESVFQALIDAEATAAIGAGPHQRNGYRDRLVTTGAGDVELRIPKLRAGSFFPSLLERRRRIDQALFAVVMEAYVTGTSTRKVDDLVVAMGADSGISKSEVSRICADLDTEVAAFRDPTLAECEFPYVFLDATFCKARIGGDRRGRGSRVAAQAVVIATGVSADGRREVLGFDVGDSEACAFWTAFLRTLKTRGLTGVQLVAVVRNLRRHGSGDIVVLASQSIIRALLAADEVDRLSLNLAPEIVGAGARLFPDGLPASSWSLHDTRTSDSGAIWARYDRKRADAQQQVSDGDQTL